MDPLSIQSTLRGISGVGQLQPAAPFNPELPLVSPLDTTVDASRSSGGTSFSKTLSNYLQEVNEQVLEADGGVAELASGKSKSVHEALITMQKADMQVRVLVETRNKIVRAYEEIMRMQA